IIYTSGSTGTPKGVMVEHRNVVRLVKNTNTITFSEGDRLLQTGALEFDASTFEIWGSLLNGLGLYLAGKETILSPESLKETIQKNHIGIMWMTVAMFNQLLQEDIGIFGGLGTLLVGGDVLSPPHINRLREKYPRLNIINGYGPTENTTFSTTFLIGKEYSGPIPIGHPVSNSTAYIVDKYNHPVPIGVVGELIVGGDGVARGYMNNPELTAKRFTKSFVGSRGGFSKEPLA
ncbi:MAG: AMP-binding protein, partial [bacterium]|nr:AMP-binding protein [bacterium]